MSQPLSEYCADTEEDTESDTTSEATPWAEMMYDEPDVTDADTGSWVTVSDSDDVIGYVSPDSFDGVDDAISISPITGSTTATSPTTYGDYYTPSISVQTYGHTVSTNTV